MCIQRYAPHTLWVNSHGRTQHKRSSWPVDAYAQPVSLSGLNHWLWKNSPGDCHHFSNASFFSYCFKNSGSVHMADSLSCTRRYHFASGSSTWYYMLLSPSLLISPHYPPKGFLQNLESWWVCTLRKRAKPPVRGEDDFGLRVNTQTWISGTGSDHSKPATRAQICLLAEFCTRLCFSRAVPRRAALHTPLFRTALTVSCTWLCRPTKSWAPEFWIMNLDESWSWRKMEG